MDKIIKFYFVLVLLAGLSACQDDYNEQLRENPPINDGNGSPTALDHWLEEQFQQPYNIEIKYHWDATDVDIYRNLVPAEVSKVQTVMEVVKNVWINPYVELAGKDFMSQYSPKQFVLVGSARYNFDGSITLGTADGGRRVVLYVVNDFDSKAHQKVKQLIHTIEHEFTHILNQRVSYPSAFKEVTPGAYTASWTQVSLADARLSGFITSYAMSSPDEDFAEMVSMMLIEGKERFENILNCETSNASYSALRKKEQLVVEYFKKSFGIDFYTLQSKVQEAIRSLAPEPAPGGPDLPPLLDVWGFGKDYTHFHVDLLTIQESDEVVTRFVYDNNALHRSNIALDPNFQLVFIEPELLVLQLYYYNTLSSVREYKLAKFVYNITESSEPGMKNIRSVSGDDNAAYLVSLGAVYLPGYFHNEFVLDWAVTCSGDAYAAFFPGGNRSNYCLGVLGN